jgi:hypothetical protein
MIDSMMSKQLQTGDAVRVLPTGEIGLLVRVDRLYPASALVSLGAEGFWAFPIETIDRVDDLRSFCRDGRDGLSSR